jgi:hypothetical protein
VIRLGRRSRQRRRIDLFVPPTIDLTMLQPSGREGSDPLAGLVVVLAWVWLVGVPWLRFCWWLGHRPRREGTTLLARSLRAPSSAVPGALASPA